MEQEVSTRVAWLFSAMGTGGISFQHILCEFTKNFPNTVAFAGQWAGYAVGFEDTFTVQEVGSTRYVRLGEAKNGYAIGFSYASPQIVTRLLQFKPQIVFANAFTMWTIIALLLKPIGRWKVIIVYEGGSSTYENPSSTIRHQARRLMARLADAFVVNSQSGKVYLLNILNANPDRVFARPFLIPSVEALSQNSESEVLEINSHLKRPVFLFVGQVVPRKGLKSLLTACLNLKLRGYNNFTLMVVGDGEQRSELECYVNDTQLNQQVFWVGKVSYSCLGAYFNFADVFVFPTYDDIWGMVLAEAMTFGMPVICSQKAGAVDMVLNGENGFIFDPDKIERLAELMLAFIRDSELIKGMGKNSRSTMAQYTSNKVIQPFLDAMNSLEKSQASL